MINTESVLVDGTRFTRTFSDNKVMIQKVGTDEIYEDAMDVLDFSYEETEIPVIVVEQDDPYAIIDILTGEA